MAKRIGAGITLLLMFSICACDCVRIAKGVVLDSNTGMPVDSVLVQVANSEDRVYSDNTGNFEIHSISGGFRCPPTKVVVVKPGYVVRVMVIKEGPCDTIYLAKYKWEPNEF